MKAIPEEPKTMPAPPPDEPTERDVVANDLNRLACAVREERVSLCELAALLGGIPVLNRTTRTWRLR